MGLISALIFSQISDARNRRNEQWDIEQAHKFGCKSLQEYYALLRENEKRMLFKRKNESWFRSGTKKGFKFIYIDERKSYIKYNSIPNPVYYRNKWIDFNFLVNKDWNEEGIGSYKQNVQYLSEAVGYYYILENKLYEQDLTKEQFNFHLNRVREEVNQDINRIIDYQESKKMEKLKKEKGEILEFEPDDLDHDVKIGKQQLETLNLQKQIIDKQVNLTKEQLKINDQVQESNLNYINVFENNKEKENGR